MTRRKILSRLIFPIMPQVSCTVTDLPFSKSASQGKAKHDGNGFAVSV